MGEKSIIYYLLSVICRAARGATPRFEDVFGEDVEPLGAGVETVVEEVRVDGAVLVQEFVPDVAVLEIPGMREPPKFPVHIAVADCAGVRRPLPARQEAVNDDLRLAPRRRLEVFDNGPYALGRAARRRLPARVVRADQEEGDLRRQDL